MDVLAREATTAQTPWGLEEESQFLFKNKEIKILQEPNSTVLMGPKKSPSLSGRASTLSEPLSYLRTSSQCIPQAPSVNAEEQATTCKITN